MPVFNMFSEILCSVSGIFFFFILCGGFYCLAGAQTEVPGLRFRTFRVLVKVCIADI